MERQKFSIITSTGTFLAILAQFACLALFPTRVEAQGTPTTVTILHSFGDGSVVHDGTWPFSGPILGSDGNYYGTTEIGGNSGSMAMSSQGVVYSMTPSGHVTILHSFGDGSVPNDGADPRERLLLASDGNFYGVTNAGGAGPDFESFAPGSGTIFKMTPSGQVTILHSFNDGTTPNDGYDPLSALTLGPDGNFYGMTSDGGTAGKGTVYKITPSGQYSIIHSFGDGSVANDGFFPFESDLVLGPGGDFYGTTAGGGTVGGTAFKISPSGQVEILHFFGDGTVPNDGTIPSSGLTLGSDGNFYGATFEGGFKSSQTDPGSGVFYKMTPSGQVTILHAFGDGSVPNDGKGGDCAPVEDLDGNLYGTAGGGSANDGVFFRITPSGQYSIIHFFGDGSVPNDGAGPGGYLLVTSDGGILGATTQGGENSQGTIYKLLPGTAPLAPTNLTATGGNGQVALTWNASAGATSYNVYRSTASGGETLYQSNVSNTTYMDTGVINGTTYYYEVTAVNSGGESGKSNEASATPEPPVPAAPTGLTATGGNGQVALNWTASTGATSYNIYRSSASGSEALYQSNITTTGYTDTAVINDTTYYYEVTAVNGGGESGKSNEASATPFAPITFQAGLQMISVPFDYSTTPLDTLFGYSNVELAVWSPTSNSYALSPVAPADHIRLGQGYWVRFPQQVTITTPGTPAPTTQNFDIPLAQGWNMIGDPFLVSIPTSNLLFDNGTESFAQATTGANPLIGATLWSYPEGSTAYTPATSLAPEQGYWVFAFSATDMEVPHP